MIDHQYINLCRKLIQEGTWIHNERTGKKCLTLKKAIFEYNPVMSEDGAYFNNLPMDTTRQSFWKSAVAELLGYLRGYDNAYDFVALGTKTWLANASSPSWTSNPHYRGDGDMGKCYGVIGHDFGGVNQFTKVYENLKMGIDDRGEIITFWKPDDFDKACLRPCMYQHHFSLIQKDLSLISYQRSCDVPLGLNFNMIQVFVFLCLMARITGNKPTEATHIIVNPHIYEDQYDTMLIQIQREPMDLPILWINPRIKDWDDVLKCNTDDFDVICYQSHGPLKYPMSV